MKANMALWAGLVLSVLVYSTQAQAVTVNSAALSSADFTQQPPVLMTREVPLVMLGLSVDNQLFYKAYTDYSDIDSDGQLDTTYKDNFEYYGYFDSSWCYSYGSGTFSPSEPATGANGHYCGSSRWSGNFLNWATMTRMDVLRRVLYGGKRFTDTVASTVLERAYIPSDVHAFAKVYKGADVSNLTPFTTDQLTDNTLTVCNVSSSHPYTSSSVPQIRLAKGNHRRWSINESNQCQWGSGANRPPDSDRLNMGSEHTVRVEACVAGKEATSDFCKSYPDGNAKPVGLLQQYGESGALKFGLISGSYENYVSGGVLRKNIGLFGSNSDPADDEIDLGSGVFRNVDGILSNIDALRVIGWSGSVYDSSYTCNTPGISIADFKGGTAPCRDWGNPISEIYLEAVRYFAGASAATPAFATANDSSYIADLSQATWPASLNVDVHPLNSETRCAACSIVMISSGVSSFDSDELTTVSDVAGMSGVSDLSAQTDAVGALEYGTFPQEFLVGDVAPVGGADQLCSSKSLSGLSVALGICPEAPALEGSHQIVGLANHAKTEDLRTDQGMDGDQVVDTYGVELAETVPSFSIPVGTNGEEIRFLPACQSRSGDSGEWIPCSLFDVELLDTEVNSVGELISGTLVFHWEDSSWGNDYDLDGSQVISFCVGGSASNCDDSNNDSRTGASYDDIGVSSNHLRISQGVAYSAAGFNLRFGYVVTGSSGKDGAPGGTNRHEWLVRPGNQNRNDLDQLSGSDSRGFPLLPIPCDSPSTCSASDPGVYDYFPESEDFAPSSNSAKLLDRPLLLAAKYGGFRDRDDSGDPTHSSGDNREWDLTNNRTGAAGPDGIPDNYFFSSNPGLLAGQLQRVFEALVARTASGTNAAVVANSSSGVGAVYQALYQPQFSSGSSMVTWTGTLRAIFIDDSGYLREDSNGNAKLDDYATDKIVRFEFNDTLDQTFVRRYNLDGSNNLIADGAEVRLDELKPIWSAVDNLANMSTPEAQKVSYGSTSGDRRYVLTALDLNGDAETDQQDVLPFTATELAAASPSNYYQYLGLTDSSTANTLIDYIRGKEVAGLRSRTIDYDNDGTAEVWRLGDIIHSTPAVVASPDSDYSVAFSDSTYRTFQNQYADRRQMVYVGANDGMIHAFNGGFWSAGDKEFRTQPLRGTAANHALGQEMWAYAPYNLLPHLRWLSETDYQHVYYMDGEPMAFDANIFPASAKHPGGWGTVLVIGMRFGGAPIQVDVGGTARVMRSAYVVFDVTDPEDPPTLLGEVTVPELGFTLSKPALIKNRQPEAVTGDWTSPSVNEWYLVLGSGPKGTSALGQAESDQTARLFAIDLKQLVTNANSSTSGTSYFTTLGGSTVMDLGGANGFVGGLRAMDWNRDNADDSIYLGTIEGSAASPTGKLHRVRLNNSSGWVGPSGATEAVMMDVGRPIQATPRPARDMFGDRWVLFGTGRLLVPSDSDLEHQEYFFGVKESKDASNNFTFGQIDVANLLDTSDIGVFETSGDVRDLSSGTPTTLVIDGEEVNKFSSLEGVVRRRYPGWKLKMQKPASAPSGRVIGSARLNPVNRKEFAFTEYVPPAESCELDGESFLYSLSILTGTATPDAPLSTSNRYVVNDREVSESVVSVGAGYASEVTFHQGIDGGLTGITNSSTGAIEGTPFNVAAPISGRQSWRQIESISF